MFVCLSFGLGWHQVLSKKGTQDWLRFFWHTGYLTSFWRWIMHCHICIAYMCRQCARRDARQELFDLAHAYLNDEWLFAISRFVAYIGALQFYEFLLHRKVFFCMKQFCVIFASTLLEAFQSWAWKACREAKSRSFLIQAQKPIWNHAEIWRSGPIMWAEYLIPVGTRWFR